MAPERVGEKRESFYLIRNCGEIAWENLAKMLAYLVPREIESLHRAIERGGPELGRKRSVGPTPGPATP